jgi:hypothetical protein
MCLVRSVTYVSGRSLLCLTTYVLRSKATCCLYTGSTSDLVRRLEQHNADVSTSTKHRGPWELVHREDFFGFTSLSSIGGSQEASDGAGFTCCSISEAFPERLDTSRS